MTARNHPQLSYSTLGTRLRPPVITRLMTTVLERPQMLSLAAGFTDNAILPAELVADATARLATKHRDQAHLQYGMNQGNPTLRGEVLPRALGTGDHGVDAGDVVITNGSQQALYLLAQTMCDPGDIVLVEAPTYFVFLEVLKGLGVEARSLPMTPEGDLDPAGLDAMRARLEAAGEWDRVKAVYLVSYYSNPSTRCLPEEPKRQLARWLRVNAPDRLVIEDGAYRDLYYTEPFPARPLLALKEAAGLPVAYAGTFTKPFATGLKVGYLVCTHAELRRKLLQLKGHQDFGTAQFNQALLVELLENGGYEEQLARARRHYARKAAIFAEALKRHGLAEAGWTWDAPTGGLLFWARGPEALDTRIDSPFCDACLADDVLYVPGDLCFAEGEPHHYARLSIGALPEAQLDEGARRFSAVARRLAPKAVSTPAAEPLPAGS